MTPTTPNREDWEKTKNVLFNWNKTMEQAVENLVKEAIQNHNNALVAEIEKLKLVGTEYIGHLNSEGFNRALDTIIRIIQEK